MQPQPLLEQAVEAHGLAVFLCTAEMADMYLVLSQSPQAAWSISGSVAGERLAGLTVVKPAPAA